MEYTYVPVEGVRVTARGICVKDGNVLVVKRVNKGKDYMVLPGGGIDVGESPLEAVKREFLEETSIGVEPIEVVGKMDARPGHNAQIVIKVSYVSGEPKLDPGSEEYAHSLAGDNIYEPTWVSIEQAREELVPEDLRLYL